MSIADATLASVASSLVPMYIGRAEAKMRTGPEQGLVILEFGALGKRDPLAILVGIADLCLFFIHGRQAEL